MTEKLSEGLRTVFLAGVGAAAFTAEKSKVLFDELVKKGELKVRQGKTLNRELKRNIKSSVAAAKAQTDILKPETTASDVLDCLPNLSPEEIAAVKEKLAQMEA